MTLRKFVKIIMIILFFNFSNNALADKIQKIMYENNGFISQYNTYFKEIKIPIEYQDHLEKIKLLSLPQDVSILLHEGDSKEFYENDLMLSAENVFTNLFAKIPSYSEYPIKIKTKFVYRKGKESWFKKINFRIKNPDPEAIQLFDSNLSKIILSERTSPWGSVVKIIIKSGGICSGFFIAENTIATAQHCIYDFLKGRVRSSEELIIKTMAAPRLKLSVKNILVNSSGKLAKTPYLSELTHDWSFIELNEPVGKFIGYFPINHFKKTELNFLKIGYGTGVALGLYAEGPCSLQLSFLYRDIAYHNCPGYDGDSGGPILTLKDGHIVAVGIHVARFKKDNKQFGIVRLFPKRLAEQANTFLKSELAINDMREMLSDNELEYYQSKKGVLFDDIVRFLKAAKVLHVELEGPAALRSFLKRNSENGDINVHVPKNK